MYSEHPATAVRGISTAFLHPILWERDRARGIVCTTFSLARTRAGRKEIRIKLLKFLNSRSEKQVITGGIRWNGKDSAIFAIRRQVLSAGVRVDAVHPISLRTGKFSRLSREVGKRHVEPGRGQWVAIGGPVPGRQRADIGSRYVRQAHLPKKGQTRFNGRLPTRRS
jgi:hypothetical protein